MKTVLVDNFLCARTTGGTNVQIVPHLGLMSLGAVLERAGYPVEICDPKILFIEGGWTEPNEAFLDAWTTDLIDRRPDVVGFTAYGRTLPSVIRIAERLKGSNPDVRMLLGGPHATILGAEILQAFTCFDAIVRYEAEPFIADLIGCFAADRLPAAVPNLWYRENGEVIRSDRVAELPALDSLPPAALHLYPLRQLQLGELSIEAGRGCPYACTFCSTASFFQRKYRVKDSATMLEEMEAARGHYGVNVFNLNHDLFGLVRRSVVEFCRLAEGRDFIWKCSMRPDVVDRSLVDWLARAGCRHIYFGVESGSPRMQRVMQKRLDLEETRHTVRTVVERGIHATVSFVTGFPEETCEDQDETLDLLGELLLIDPASVHPQLHVLSPEPGSPLCGRDLSVSYDGFGPELDDFLDDELIRAHPRIFSVFYHYDSGLSRDRAVIASAIVSHLLPELGYPLVAHVLGRFYGGRLSRLCAELTSAVVPGARSFESLIAQLRAAFDAIATALGSRAPYVADLARFGRIAAMARRQRRASAEGAWLVRFDHDVEQLARLIVGDPQRVLPAAAMAARERWCVLRADASQRMSIGHCSPDIGRLLYRSSTTDGPSAQESACADACGARFLWI